MYVSAQISIAILHMHENYITKLGVTVALIRLWWCLTMFVNSNKQRFICLSIPPYSRDLNVVDIRQCYLQFTAANTDPYILGHSTMTSVLYRTLSIHEVKMDCGSCSTWLGSLQEPDQQPPPALQPSDSTASAPSVAPCSWQDTWWSHNYNSYINCNMSDLITLYWNNNKYIFYDWQDVGKC